jgi:hypothetical protein
MKLAEFAKGSATFLVVIAAGFLSTAWVDRHFAAGDATTRATPTTSSSAAACVGEDRAWKNWPFPNVPALSPKCNGGD